MIQDANQTLYNLRTKDPEGSLLLTILNSKISGSTRKSSTYMGH